MAYGTSYDCTIIYRDFIRLKRLPNTIRKNLLQCTLGGSLVLNRLHVNTSIDLTELAPNDISIGKFSVDLK